MPAQGCESTLRLKPPEAANECTISQPQPTSVGFVIVSAGFEPGAQPAECLIGVVLDHFVKDEDPGATAVRFRPRIPQGFVRHYHLMTPGGYHLASSCGISSGLYPSGLWPRSGSRARSPDSGERVPRRHRRR